MILYRYIDVGTEFLNQALHHFQIALLSRKV
jgi:hypothetical protein